MDDSIEPDQAVFDRICELYEVVHARDWCANCGLVAEPKQFQRSWSALKDALNNCREVIQNPRPGRGLMSVWLQSLYERAKKVRANGSWRLPTSTEFIHYEDENLLRLVTTDRERGYSVVKYLNAGRTDFPDLFESDTSALEQLRDVAQQWAIKWHELEASAKARGSVPHLSEYANSPEFKQAGRLLLEAINKCELPPHKLDEEMRERVLQNVDTPDSLVWGNMTGARPEDLTALIARLAPTPPQGAPPKVLPSGYSNARMLERDQWIYEHIPLYDVDTLKHKLEIELRRKKWKLIGSRSGFLKAAAKYADAFELPRHTQFNIRSATA